MSSCSTILRPLSLIAIGFLYALTFAGARLWAEDLGLHMNWWKWALAALWYLSLSISLAAGFTLIGEKERQAGGRFLFFSIISMVILGAALWFVL